MAYPVASESVTPEGTTNSITISMPENHQSGDLFVAFFTQNSNTASTMAASGWTSIGTQAAERAQKTHVFYKFAASSNESSATFTSTVTALSILTVHCVRGADPTNPIDSFNREQTASPEIAPQFGAMTTNTDNTLVLYGTGYTGISTQGHMIPRNPVELTMLSRNHNTINQTVSYRNQYTAGSIFRPVMQYERTVNSGSLWTVAIKDDGNGRMAPEPVTTYTPILYGGLQTNVHQYDSSLWTPLDTFTPTSVAGRPMTSIQPIVTTTAVDAVDGYGYMTSFNTTSVSGVDDTGIWIGGTYTATGTHDLTGKLIAVHFTVNNMSSVQMGEEGVAIIFEDTSGEWAAFTLQKREGGTTGNHVAIIDVENWPPLDESGSIDWADIKMIGFMFHKSTTNTTSRTLAFRNLVAVDKITLTGGNSGRPVSPSDLRTFMHGWAATGMTPLQGTGQTLLRLPLQIGDGSTPTYFSARTTSIETPLSWSPSIRRRFDMVGDEQLGYTVYASASDTIRFGGSLVLTNTKQPFTIHPDSSIDATYGFDGAIFSGWEVTGKAGVTFNGATFESCYQIDLQGGGLVNASVTNSLDAIAVTTDDPGEISNTEFISGGSGHAIEATATGSFDFEGNTFTGYAETDGTTGNEAFYNNSGGEITLVIPSGGDVPSIRNGAGATTIIDTPTANQSVTISGAVAGSRIEIYDLTSDTQLYNGTPTFPYTWTDSNPYAADREIRLRVAYVDGATAKKFIEVNIGTSTSTTPALAYQVNQEDDTVYNTNAVDGSGVTGISIDDDTMLLEINDDSVSCKDIYAYEMYWLFTETGIEDLGQSVTAPDTANYLMDSNVLKIKNISGSATILTDGWIRDKTSGSTLDIVDTTGDTLFSNPPHVVAYSVEGSPVITGDIADVPTVAEIADGVLDEALSGHTTAGTLGKVIADTAGDAELAAIK